MENYAGLTLLMLFRTGGRAVGKDVVHGRGRLRAADVPQRGRARLLPRHAVDADPLVPRQRRHLHRRHSDPALGLRILAHRLLLLLLLRAAATTTATAATTATTTPAAAAQE